MKVESENRRRKLGIRIKAGAALVVVFLLVLATNQMDSHHFTIVRESLTTVYEDRLLAKDYLYKISRQLQQQREVLRRNDPNINKIKATNDSIQTLMDIYGRTRLTENEARYYESFDEKLSRLKAHNLSEGANPEHLQLTDQRYQALFEDLDSLYKIQLEESRRAISNSNRAIQASNLISQLEMGALILIGLILQVLIFAKVK